MNIKISIILSTFNEEIAIKKTINEIRKHINDVEIIVVDDNSTDRTFEILKSLENDTTKVFLRKKNKRFSICFFTWFNSFKRRYYWMGRLKYVLSCKIISSND